MDKSCVTPYPGGDEGFCSRGVFLVAKGEWSWRILPSQPMEKTPTYTIKLFVFSMQTIKAFIKSCDSASSSCVSCSSGNNQFNYDNIVNNTSDWIPLEEKIFSLLIILFMIPWSLASSCDVPFSWRHSCRWVQQEFWEGSPFLQCTNFSHLLCHWPKLGCPVSAGVDVNGFAAYFNHVGESEEKNSVGVIWFIFVFYSIAVFY